MKILLSDMHIAPFRTEKFLTQKKNFIEKIIQFFAGILEKKEENLLEMMEKISREESIDLIISNGDLMESVATERGMATERDFFMAKEIIFDLENNFKAKLELNMGNHESGYILPLSTDDEGGISKRSLKNFLLLIAQNE